MDIREALLKTVKINASDLHITLGLPPMARVNGMLKALGDEALTHGDTVQIAKSILNEAQFEILEQFGEVDLSYQLPNAGRFRVNVYKQRRSFSAAFRVIESKIPTIDGLGFPDILKELSLKQRGLILLTGPTGCGKSTTLAAMVNHINQNRNCHIITIEDPIEYLHVHNQSMINQREVGSDSMTFANALRAALREDPDVILVGEMRDLETIATAITAAETGHLVMSTLHTSGVDQTIDRMIDVFPSYQQQQIRIQLAAVIEGIIAQQLLPDINNSGRVAALEIMVATGAIRNLIRESKTHQIQTVIQTSIKQGMRSMDYSLSELVRRGMISDETAFTYCVDPEMLKRYLYTQKNFFEM
jgi:twitching motility protein PilT